MKYNILVKESEYKTKGKPIKTKQIVIRSKTAKEGEFRIPFKDVEDIYKDLCEEYDKDKIAIVVSRKDGFKTIKSFRSILDSEEDYLKDKASDVKKFMKYSYVKFSILS